MYVKDGMLIFNLNGTSSKLWKDYHGEYACIADNHYSTSIVTSKIFVKGTSLGEQFSKFLFAIYLHAINIKLYYFFKWWQDSLITGG